MKYEDCKIGMRVRVKDRFCKEVGFKGETGTIHHVFTDGQKNIKINFDKQIVCKTYADMNITTPTTYNGHPEEVELIGSPDKIKKIKEDLIK